MKHPYRVLALALTIAGVGACGNRAQPTVDVSDQKMSADVTVKVNATLAKPGVTYPIIAHPSQGGECDVVEWTRQRTHLKRGWTVDFVMRNNCEQPQDMSIVDNDSLFNPGLSQVTVPAHGVQRFTLTVSDTAAFGNHKSDIKVGTKKYDPDWQVDP